LILNIGFKHSRTKTLYAYNYLYKARYDDKQQKLNILFKRQTHYYEETTYMGNYFISGFFMVLNSIQIMPTSWK